MTTDGRGDEVNLARLFEGFVEQSAAGLLRLASVVTADRATAQDVVQSVLERAFRDWSRIGSLDNPEAYVRRMVTNEAISTSRRMSRIVLTDSVVDRASPTDEVERLSEIDNLVDRLRQLPPRQRAAITLRYLYDLPDNEIARHLGCRPVSVRGYVLRGLRALRVNLAAESDEGGFRPISASSCPEAT